MSFLKSLFLACLPFLAVALLVRWQLSSALDNPLSALASWGLLQDLLWSLLVSLLVLWMPVWRGLALLGLWTLWTLTLWLDSQSWLALGAGADYRDVVYLLDPVFLRSSVASLSPLLLISILLGVCLSAYLAARYANWLAMHRPGVITRQSSLTVVVLIAMLLIIPSGRDWQERNGFGAQWASFFKYGKLDDTAMPTLRHASLNAAVASSKWLDEPGRARNVLLIVLEGIPGPYLPQVAAARDVSSPVSLEGLGRWADNAAIVPDWVTPTRQTLRGLYALLCADYPRLDGGTPKALSYVENPALGEQCLPAELAKAGYYNAFMQAADLEFMSKGSFMPAIGFERVQGQSSFERRYTQTNTGYSWGPTDPEFFEQVYSRLLDIDDEHERWFVTLLTAGTHHPYGIQAEPGSTLAENKLEAVRVMDRAASGFLDKLSAQGILENTLVIVTTDEAHGLQDQEYGTNWGLMFVVGPDVSRTWVEGTYSLLDVPRSILDYLGLDYPWGESIFRSPAPVRPLAFGRGGERLLTDGEEIHHCPSWRVKLEGTVPEGCYSRRGVGEGLFNARYEVTAEGGNATAYQQLAKMHLDIEGINRGGYDQLPLVAAGAYPIHATRQRYLGGGNYMDLGEYGAVTLRLKAGYKSSEGGKLRLVLQGRDGADQKDLIPPVPLPSLAHGQRVELRYVAPLENELKRSQFRLDLLPRGAGGVLELESFTLSTQHAAPERSELRVRWRGQVMNYALSKEAGWQPLPPWGEENLPLQWPMFFGEGWYPPENAGIWSGGQATIELPLASTTQGLLLSAFSRAALLAGGDSTEVEIYMGDRRLALWEFTSEANWGDRRVNVPAEMLAPGQEVLRLNFIVSKTASPGSGDDRELGVLLQNFRLDPL